VPVDDFVCRRCFDGRWMPSRAAIQRVDTACDIGSPLRNRVASNSAVMNRWSGASSIGGLERYGRWSKACASNPLCHQKNYVSGGDSAGARLLIRSTIRLRNAGSEMR
jgi:hypothetical protein